MSIPLDESQLSRVVRDSRVWEIAIAVASMVVIGLLTWGIARVLARWLSGKTRFGLRGLHRLAAPMTALASTGVAVLLLHRTSWDPPVVAEFLRLLVIVLGFWFGTRIIDVVWATTQASARLRAGHRVASLLITGRHVGKLVLGLTALGVLAVQIGASEQLYVVLAAAAAGVAFAARDPIRNAVAYAALAVEMPFHIGDRVRISDFRSGESSVGTVTDLSLTAVTLRTRERTNIVIANLMLGQLRIENLTAADRRRLELAIPVEGLPTELLREACPVIEREIREHPGVSSEREPRVWLSGTGDGLRLKASLWLRRAADRREIQRDVLLKIHDRLARGRHDRTAYTKETMPQAATGTPFTA